MIEVDFSVDVIDNWSHHYSECFCAVAMIDHDMILLSVTALQSQDAFAGL